MSPVTRDEPREQPDDLSLALSEDLLAAEYVLGTLDGEERKGAQDRIASDPAFAALVGRWERRLGELHVLTADMEPPPALWDAVKEKRAAVAPSETVRLPDPTPPQPMPSPSATPPDIRALRARMARWRTLAVFTGSLAAALLAFILLPKWAPGLLPPSLTPKPPAPLAKSAEPGSPSRRYVAVLERDAVPPAFVLVFDAGAHSLTLRRVGAPREPGKSYELWLISSRLAAPRSLGLFGPEDVTELGDVLADDPGLIGDASFAVSLEPEGGSPTGAPSNVAFSGKPMEANSAVTRKREAQ
jgi:anti-sigma-K factor RskA